MPLALAQSALTNVTQVPNIKDDFALPRRMPIRTTDQQAGSEVHDIGTGTGTQRGKDFIESPTLLGKANLLNRHVECTDCHNPHRVIKNRLFNANATVPDAGGTHNHAAGPHQHRLGRAQGQFGVQPVYGGATFGTLPAAYDIKRGDGGVGASTAVSSTWVTREYQVCLKCHSNYAYDTPPRLGDSGGGTPSGTNGLLNFTNQAMEFQAPLAHKGEVTHRRQRRLRRHPARPELLGELPHQQPPQLAPGDGQHGPHALAARHHQSSPWRAPWNGRPTSGRRPCTAATATAPTPRAATVVPNGTACPGGPTAPPTTSSSRAPGPTTAARRTAAPCCA